MEHNKNEDVKRGKQFRCFSCKTVFSSLEELCRHVALRCKSLYDKQPKAALNPFQCRKCFQIFSRNDLYEKHWSGIHRDLPTLFMYENPHPCEHCGLMFHNSRALRMHQIRRKCIAKSVGYTFLPSKINESETINNGHTNADSLINKEENSLIHLSGSGVKDGESNFTISGSIESENNVFVPLYFSDYIDRRSRQKDTQINKPNNNSARSTAAINSLIFTKSDDLTVPEIAKTVSDTEKNLFESLGTGLTNQTVVAAEIVNDKEIDSFHGSRPDCETNKSSEPTESFLSSGCFEDILQAYYIPSLLVRKKQSRKEKVIKISELLKTRKRYVECRICHLNIGYNKYRQHFSKFHSDCAVDDMFDDGWKCSLCSSAHRDIDELRMHWIRKHKEYYNKDQFREFKKQNAALRGSTSI